jgi:hypothetical protein
MSFNTYITCEYNSSKSEAQFSIFSNSYPICLSLIHPTCILVFKEEDLYHSERLLSAQN